MFHFEHLMTSQPYTASRFPDLCVFSLFPSGRLKTQGWCDLDEFRPLTSFHLCSKGLYACSHRSSSRVSSLNVFIRTFSLLGQWSIIYNFVGWSNYSNGVTRNGVSLTLRVLIASGFPLLWIDRTFQATQSTYQLQLHLCFTTTSRCTYRLQRSCVLQFWVSSLWSPDSLHCLLEQQPQQCTDPSLWSQLCIASDCLRLGENVCSRVLWPA